MACCWSPIRYYSPAGASGSSACAPGSYKKSSAMSANCPARFFCNGTVTPEACLEGVSLSPKYSVAANVQRLAIALMTECLQCPDGFYCACSGLTQPTGRWWQATPVYSIEMFYSCFSALHFKTSLCILSSGFSYPSAVPSDCQKYIVKTII